MPTVLLGIPTYSGLIPAITVQSLLQLHKPVSCGVIVVERQRIDKARNAMAMACLEGGFDYLFFVDDDNPIPADTLEVFLEDDKDIVTAPILSRNPDGNGRYPLCSFYSKEIKVEDKDLKLYFPIEVFRDEGPLHKVDATGTGCVLIKRKVLEELTKRHDTLFEFGEIKFEKSVMVDGRKYDKRTMSEDVEFSERAVNAGFEIWLDERIKPVHITGNNLIKWGNGNG